MDPDRLSGSSSDQSPVLDSALASPSTAIASAYGHEAKKPRACEACRALKVRCEPDEGGGDECRRCAKAGRRCVVTAPTRKRQKKTDSRVSELERKIDALTASLQARAVSSSSSNRVDEPTAVKRKADYDPLHHYDDDDDNDDDDDDDDFADEDVVDRGLVSAEKASELLRRYNTSMMCHLPAVVFPAGMTAAELRRTKPCLFLAVMAAASSETHELQRQLQRLLMRMLAHKIVVTGEKKVELVQALQVAVIWYWPPEHMEELKFYQLVHMAAVMALDLGLGRRRSATMMGWRENHVAAVRRPDPTSIECRRAWLACHYLAANTAMSLHRPNLIRWSAFMDESLDVLAKSAESAPTDGYFCHLVWTHRMAEEIGIQLSADDGAGPLPPPPPPPPPPLPPSSSSASSSISSSASLADARTRYALRALERDLDRYRAGVSPDLMQPTLKSSFHLLSLYMHELVLHAHASTEQVRPPFNAEAVVKNGLVPGEALSTTAAHISALSACLTAIDGILDTFLAMDVPSVRCLPVFSFVRVAYAIVVLIKMFVSASDPASDLGRVMDRENMRVDAYLDALLVKFRAAADGHACRPAAKFLVVFVMLKTWFVNNHHHHQQQQQQQQQQPPQPPQPQPQPPKNQQEQQRKQHPNPDSSPQNNINDPTTTTTRPPPQDETPLQVLSEAAATESPTPFTTTILHQSTRPVFTPSTQPLFPDPSSWSTPPSSLDPVSLLLPPGLDLEDLGLPLDAQGQYEGGPKMVLSEPWLTDVFQGLPDTNVFPF
ncbi:hypothetical protein CP533_0858 [Ophiocordyceps camponoti-saundersi (nom. inval.)]|nr:hypothetical protein CP533_0858 [Ophiocordyceps camponoti-saundersi (nom. inval.)]